MIKHVKPTRLPICRGLVAFALGCLALIFSVNAFAIDQMYNWNGLEFVTSGNVTHVHPASPESTRLRGGWVVEFPEDQPEIRAKHQLPYKHKGGADAVIEVRPKVDPAKVAAKAKDAIKAGAAGLATGGGYVALASITCTLLCDAAIDALKDWGVDGLSLGSDGGISLQVPDIESAGSPSDGTLYRFSSGDRTIIWGEGNTAIEACNNAASARALSVGGVVSGTPRLDGPYCEFSTKVGDASSIPRSLFPYDIAHPCAVGLYYVGGSCVTTPTVSVELSQYLSGAYVGKGWSHHWAKMTAEIVAANGNVFTDGTSVEITGPSIVPLSTSETRTSVNLIPGTNTPAPVGHTGPTDPGTQTTTSTTTAKNVYNPAPFGTGSGPSMTTGQQVQTTTNITNNVTNNTTTNNTVTETDQAPEKEQEDFCEKNPDSLACAEADTPEAEIPEGQINISYEYADIFGNGACPADVYLTTHGQSLKVWDWQSTCSNVQTYFRPVLIACCAFIAFVIVSAGAKE